MPRPKTPSPWRPPRISRLLPPLLLLLAGSSLPLAHAAPRPAGVTVAGVVVPGHNSNNTTTEPCRPRPHVADSARGKMAVGGGGGGGGTTAGPPCGFYDGDPARPLVPPAGMGCSVDEAARVWGFCPAVRGVGGSFVDPGPLPRRGGARSFASSAPCKLTTTCYDAFACKEGCGVADEGDSDAVDEAVHGVDEGIKGDEDEDEGEDKGRGRGDVARRLSGRSLARVMCPQHDASKYCNMAVWIRRDDVRFTSLTCGTAAGSTTSIYEASRRTTAALTTTATAATAGGGGGGGPGGGTPSAAPTPPTTLHSHPHPHPSPPTETLPTSATLATTTTTPSLDSDLDTPADHAGDRARVAGAIAGALAGVVLAGSAALFVAYRRTRHRFGTAMQFIYRSFKSSTSSGGFGGAGEGGAARPRGEQGRGDVG
ncbi:hypothetical protein RB594_007562 [Gaeumannomyces avenae]